MKVYVANWVDVNTLEAERDDPSSAEWDPASSPQIHDEVCLSKDRLEEWIEKVKAAAVEEFTSPYIQDEEPAPELVWSLVWDWLSQPMRNGVRPNQVYQAHNKVCGDLCIQLTVQEVDAN